MMTRSNKGLGLGGVLSALVAFGVVACGDDFEGDDCKVNHRCPGGGGQSDGEGGSGASDTGEAGSGAKASGGTSSGATGNLGAGQGGQDIAPVGCTGPEACDDGDPNNGAEICGADGMCAEGNAPPTVTAVSPEADAQDVELTSEIVITFSEPLDPATIANNIRLIDGETIINGELTPSDNQVTFKPDVPLALLAEYSISVTTGVADVDGVHMLEAYEVQFVTRDGAWTVADAASGNIFAIPETLSVNDQGNALVSWITQSSASVYCPTSASWFKGVTKSATKVFNTEPQIFECSQVAAASNAAGVAAVAWQQEYSDEYVEQFRAGKWPNAVGEPVTNHDNTRWFGVGVADNGSVSLLQQGLTLGTRARRTNVEGVWSGADADIAPTKRGLSSPRLAFDSKNNGFAAWRADTGGDGKDEILVSRYTAADGWQLATTLPKSTASSSDAAFDRGAPAIAVDEDGGAMAVWLSEGPANAGSLVSSRFTTPGGWEDPVTVSGTLVLTNMTEAPGLVFDGTNYVAAFTGKDGASSYVYTSVYNVEFGEWSSYESRSVADVLPRMPSIGADDHGNLLMTWARSAGNNEASLFFARYNGRTQEWSGGRAVSDGGTIKNNLLTSPMLVPMGVGLNGHGAAIWVDKDSQGVFSKLRIAAFY